MRFALVFLIFIYAMAMAVPQSKLEFGDSGKFANKVKYFFYLKKNINIEYRRRRGAASTCNRDGVLV